MSLWICCYQSVASAKDLECASQVVALLPREVEARPQARIDGVVTLHLPSESMTYVQDATGGVRVIGLPDMPGLSLGTRLILRGTAHPGIPVPVVKADGEIQIMGAAVAPACDPLPVLLARGSDPEGMRASLEGVIMDVHGDQKNPEGTWISVELGTRSGRFTVMIPRDRETGSIARITRHMRAVFRGVATSIINPQGQRIGWVLYTQGAEDFEVASPAPADLFERPLSRVDELLRPGTDDPTRLVRVEGVVLHHGPTSIVNLRTTGGSIEFRWPWNERLIRGERIDAVGYPTVISKRIWLANADMRKIRREAEPTPINADVRTILERSIQGDLVTASGRVIRNSLDIPGGALLLESGSLFITARLAGLDQPGGSTLLAGVAKPGAVVQVTGISELRSTMTTAGSARAYDMGLMLRDEADLAILQASPWWTTSRLVALSGGLLAVLAMAGSWSILLRHKVKQQTGLIREKIEREIRWIERSRIARDIHDDVGSALTQINLLAYMGGRQAPAAETGRFFSRIGTQASGAVRALDQIVWTANPSHDSLPGTVNYLSHMVQAMAEDRGLACRVDVPAEVPEWEVGARVRHHLLLSIKEAVHNVMKHSEANVLNFRMAWDADSIEAEVADDGCGFDPETRPGGRSGLDSMRLRMHEIGGTVEINSTPGMGTRVRFRSGLHIKSAPEP